MNTEYRLRRLEQTLGTLISWLVVELGSNNARSLLDRLHAPEDLNCLEGPGRTPEEVAQNARELDAVAPTPADKFALMFTMNQQARMADLLNRFAGHLSAYLNTYPSLRTEEHDAIFKDYRNLNSGPVASDTDSIVASCDCGTKTPDIAYHKPGCRYRLIRERDEARSLVAAFEKAVNQHCNFDLPIEKDRAVSEVDYIFRLHQELRERVEKVIGHWRDTDWFHEEGWNANITVGVNEAEAIKLLKYLKL